MKRIVIGVAAAMPLFAKGALAADLAVRLYAKVPVNGQAALELDRFRGFAKNARSVRAASGDKRQMRNGFAFDDRREALDLKFAGCLDSFGRPMACFVCLCI